MAVVIEKTKEVLGVGLALRGGFQPPLARLDVVLRDAFAAVVENAKVVLGGGVALLGGLQIPLARLDVILRDA